jgi:HEAT repeat protein
LKKHKQLLLCLAVSVTLAIAAGFYFYLPSEPVYNGRTLTSWLNDLNAAVAFPAPTAPPVLAPVNRPWIPSPLSAVSTTTTVLISNPLNRASGGQISVQSMLNQSVQAIAAGLPNRNLQVEAGAAVRQMGTKSLPFLLALLHKEDSHLKITLLAALKKLQWLNIQPVTSQQRRAQALRALDELGVLAVPAWQRLLADAKSGEDLRVTAAMKLGSLVAEPQETIPLLLRHTDTPRLSTYANSAIVHYGSETAVPILLMYVGGTNLILEAQAMKVIQSFGVRAKAAVPRLFHRLESADEAIRERAADTLLSCDPVNVSAMLYLLERPPLNRRLAMCWGLERTHQQAARVVPLLARCLEDNEPQLREAAAEALAAYGPEALPARERVSRLIEDPNLNVRRAATNALRAIAAHF